MDKKKMYRQVEKNEFGKFNSGASPTEPIVDEWRILEKIVDIVKFEERLKITYQLGNENIDFVISAPSLGGIRITTTESSFFNPTEREEIHFIESDDKDIVLFRTMDGTEFHLVNGPEWTIKIFDIYNVLQYCLTKDSVRFGFYENKLVKIRLEFDIDPDDVLLGMGEKFSDINQNGKRQFLWNTNCEYNIDSDGLELWKSYKNVPLLHSSRGNTLFYASYYPAVSDLGYTNPYKGIWEFWETEFDIYIWTGTLDKRLRSYTRLTGKPFLPPKWAFRYTMGAGNQVWYGENWEKENNPEKYLKILKEMLNGYRRLGITNLSAMYGEGWIAENRIAYEILNAQGIRMIAWCTPDSELEQNRKYLPNVKEEDYPIIKIKEGSKQESGGRIDFFNHNAKVLIRNQKNDYFIKGMRGGMLGYSEQITEDDMYCNGITGKEMHNWGAYWYTKVYGEATREIVDDDYIYYCREGCAGSQQWAAVYSGNQPAELYGLKQQLNAGLSAGLCGFAVWSGDMAGYEGKPNVETYIRGVEFAAFQPLMRSHGTKTRCPWDFGKEAETVYLKYYWLRENLIEMLYSAAISSNHRGLPMMKAMALAFPGEKDYLNNGEQYLFCDTILVAPVLEEKAQTKKVCFPKGTWYELWSGNEVLGSCEREVPVSLKDCPAYLKSGIVLPVIMNEKMKWAVPFSEQNQTKVIVITPPNMDDEYRYYAEEDDKYVFKSVKEDERVFTIYSLKDIFINKLLIYGNVHEIEVDGKKEEFSIVYENQTMTALRLKSDRWNKLTITCK